MNWIPTGRVQGKDLLNCSTNLKLGGRRERRAGVHAGLGAWLAELVWPVSKDLIPPGKLGKVSLSFNTFLATREHLDSREGRVQSETFLSHITPLFPLNSVHIFDDENRGSLPNKGLLSLNFQVPEMPGIVPECRNNSDALTSVVLWNLND